MIKHPLSNSQYIIRHKLISVAVSLKHVDNMIKI